MPFFALRRTSGGAVPLDVSFKLIDDDNQPLAGVPVRLVFGIEDWRAPDAGVRLVTDQDGSARFTTPAAVSRRWSSTNIGFTGLSMPFRGDHLAVAAELVFVTPKRGGGDTEHRWLYTADIHRLPDGDCNTVDLDKVYAAGPDGRFTKLVGRNAAGPNFDGRVDGWRLSSAGYRMCGYMLSRIATTGGGTAWHLELALMRKSKPVLAE